MYGDATITLFYIHYFLIYENLHLFKCIFKLRKFIIPHLGSEHGRPLFSVLDMQTTGRAALHGILNS